MGICYDLISDRDREGYELGKGCWGMDEFGEALRSADPIAALVALLTEEEEGFSAGYVARIAREIVDFVAAHPDWRVANDAQWDGDVVDEEWMAVLLDEGQDPTDPYAPLYRMVGSRFTREPMAGVAWENLTERQRAVVLRHRASRKEP